MKKWVNRNWDEIKPGDVVSCHGEHITVDHIGDRYCKSVESNELAMRYRNDWQCDGENQFQRYEETELPDDWYLCRYRGTLTEIVRYKIGKDMHDGPSLSLVVGAVVNYKILKRARFEDLEE